MKNKKCTLALTALTATVGLVAVAGLGAPQAAASTGGVGFTARATDTSTTIETDAGSMVIDNGVFEIKAADGQVVAGTPLKYRLDDFEFPIAARIDGRTATLTPQLDPAKAEYKPVALPFENKAPFKTEYDREQAAWTRMTSTISMGATIGTLVGGLTGAAAGCVLGGIAGATVASATIVGLFGPFIPAAVLGCLGGIIAVGALGTVTGQLLVTAPVAITAVIQYFTTINQPFTPAPK